MEPTQTTPNPTPTVDTTAATHSVTQPAPQPTTSTPPTAPAKSSKWGCFLLAGIGCLGLLTVITILIGVIIFFVVQRTESNYEYDYSNYNYNTNYSNTNNTGFYNTQELSNTAQAYQLVAYPVLSYHNWSYPSIQATIPYAKTKPLTDGDYGHLWVGAKLDNGYFIQVGMASSTEVDADGNMIWNYFWEVWNAQNEYIYGYQAAMTENSWDQNGSNKFSLTCQDPDAGTWEFWVNEQTVGTTTTGDCATDLHNASLTWEVVTDKTPGQALPQFGPFQLGPMEYWDDYNWQLVPSATLTYGYGYISDGTQSDQASVCPPYGVTAAAKGQSVFSAGATLACLDAGSKLWSL